MKNIAQTKRHGQPLVKRTSYQPSRQSQLYSLFSQLTPEERTWVEKIALDIESLALQDLQNVSALSQIRIMETLMSYFQFLRKSDTDNDVEYQKKYQLVLQKRFALPVGNHQTNEKKDGAPHSGRNPGYISVSGNYNSVNNSQLELKFRPAYYDPLDAKSSHVENSGLSMGEVSILVDESDIQISELKIVAIESNSTQATNLPGDTPDLWKLSVGLERQNLACRSCLIGSLKGSLGKTLMTKPNWVLSAFLGGAVQDKTLGYGNAYVSGSIELHNRISQNTNWLAKVEQRYFFDSHVQSENLITMQFRNEISDDWDFRFEFRKHVGREFVFSIGHYW